MGWRCDRCGAVEVIGERIARAIGVGGWVQCDCGGRHIAPPLRARLGVRWAVERSTAEADTAELRVRLAAVRGIAKRALASGDVERQQIALLAIQTSGELADCLDADRVAS